MFCRVVWGVVEQSGFSRKTNWSLVWNMPEQSRQVKSSLRKSDGGCCSLNPIPHGITLVGGGWEGAD